MAKFAHLEFTKKQFKKQHLKIIPLDSIYKTLKKIENWKMRKQHSAICWNQVWKKMQERCIIMEHEGKALIIGHIYEEMIEIYKRKFSE